jgi:hypothetical protein
MNDLFAVLGESRSGGGARRVWAAAADRDAGE